MVLNNIDMAKVHNSVKIEIYKVAFESKISWDLTTNSVNETFVKEKPSAEKNASRKATSLEHLTQADPRRKTPI